MLACPAAISEVSLRRCRHFVAMLSWVLEVLVRGLWLLTKRGRRCQDKNGTFTVETTAWEGPEAATPIVGKSGRGHAISGPGVGQPVQQVAKLPKS